MKEHIYTIPLGEALQAGEPCFLCKIERDLEERALDYFMGAAVMEPDVRLVTNALGFCRQHHAAMYQMPRKLPLALAMQSRLAEIQKALHKHKKPPVPKPAYGCAVCSRVEGQMENCLENCVWLLRTDEDFLRKYLASPGVCVHHFYTITAQLRRGEGELYKTLQQHLAGQLAQLEADVARFCRMFDYKSEDTEWQEAGEVLPLAIAKLSSGRKK